MATPQPIDAGAFRTFEHAGWEAAALPYDNAWVQLTAQATGPLLDAAGVGPASRVLDVATGPGHVAAAATARGAAVIGVDFAETMLAVARRHHPHVAFRQGEADDLPFAAGSMDAIVIGFGMLHFADAERALAEAHRVLRGGGRVAFTVWARPDEAVVFRIVLDAIRQHGTLDVPLPPGPPFFRFSEADESIRALEAAGFLDPVVQHVPQVWRLPSAEAVFTAMLDGTARTGPTLRAQTPDALARIRAAALTGLQAYTRAGSLELPMPAVLAAARKP